MRKLCVVSTVELPLRFFMIPHLRALQEIYDITVVVATDDPGFLQEYGIRARVIPAPIRRNISLLEDLWALAQLITLFRREKFQIIHSIAPKAGLLAMVAGVLAWVPIRIHCFTGQVWVNSRGVKRFVLKNMDRLTSVCATHLLTDSHSQRNVLVSQRIASPEKLTVLGSGSVSGVDLDRFQSNPTVCTKVRSKLGIPLTSKVCLYLGRITKDKGVLDLSKALKPTLTSFPDTYALFVGPDEGGFQHEILSLLMDVRERVRFVGYTSAPEQYLMAADILCLPSYREGFGMVIIEAAAVGIPALASRIYGITDAVVEGFTGILHAPGASEEIAEGLHMLLADADLRIRLGNNARQRAREKFAQQILVTALLDYYRAIDRAAVPFVPTRRGNEKVVVKGCRT